MISIVVGVDSQRLEKGILAPREASHVAVSRPRLPRWNKIAARGTENGIAALANRPMVRDQRQISGSITMLVKGLIREMRLK